MSRILKIGRVSYSVTALRSMTEEEALKAHENHPTISPDGVKNAWKCANGYSKPNHLKDQLEGLKPVKRSKPVEEPKSEEVVKKPKKKGSSSKKED
jgi:hypothetical protein